MYMIYMYFLLHLPPRPLFSPPSQRGKHADDSCYIELTLKQAKINFAQIREVCKIDSENQQTFCK